MSGTIPKQFIQTVIERTDIVSLVNSYVPLKKNGTHHVACCPFHDEKTPSFTVNAKNQFYYCFGCGASGDAIAFLREYEHLEFTDAIEQLAAPLGLEVPYENNPQKTQKNDEFNQLYTLMETANKFYRWQLKNHEDGMVAIDYLKDRGIDGQTAKQFQLGFAAPGWDNLMQTLSQAKLADLIKCGMVVQRESGSGGYDRFRNRVMFPIRNHRGKTIAFGGRVLSSEDQPKYLNSPETPIFHKSNTLYGLYETKRQLKTIKRLLIVEGYMDVIALAQFGINYAVATLGTATTPLHLRQLFRETTQLIFCFDGDLAGKKAAWKALKTTLPLLTDGRQVSFLFVPHGEDPDSYIRQIGKEAFEEAIAHAKPLSELLLNRLAHELNLNSPDGQAAFISRVKPYLLMIPEDSSYRMTLEAAIINMTGLKNNQIHSQFNTNSEKNNLNKINFETIKPTLAIEQATTWLVQYPQLVNCIQHICEQLGSENLLCKLIQFLQSNPTDQTSHVIMSWSDQNEKKRLAEMAVVPLPELNDIEQELSEIANKILTQIREEKILNLLEKSKQTKLSASEKYELNQLIRKTSTKS